MESYRWLVEINTTVVRYIWKARKSSLSIQGFQRFWKPMLAKIMSILSGLSLTDIWNPVHTIPAHLTSSSYKDGQFQYPRDSSAKWLEPGRSSDWCTTIQMVMEIINDGMAASGTCTVNKLISKSKPAANCEATILVEQEAPWMHGLSRCTDSYHNIFMQWKTTINHNSKFATKPGADASGQYPFGSTDVTFRVTDECGNY